MNEFTPRERVYVGVIMVMGLLCMVSVVWAVRSQMALKELRAKLAPGVADEGDRAPDASAPGPRRGLLSGIFGRPPTPLIVPRPRPRPAARPAKPLPPSFFAVTGRRLILRVTARPPSPRPPLPLGSGLSWGRSPSRSRARYRHASLAQWRKASGWPASFRGAIQTVHFSRVKLDASALSILRHFPYLRKIGTQGGEVDAKGMTSLRLPALQHLHSRNVVDDFRWLCHVSAPTLRYLNLYHNHTIGEAGMRCIGKHRGLRSLSINGSSGINDPAMKGLAGLSFLRSLYLYDLNMTGAGLRPLGKLPSLRSLSLQKMPHLTDAGLRHLSALKSLHSLLISQTSINGSGLAHVTPHRLASLHLRIATLHPAGARALASMHGLRTLSLTKVALSEKAFRALGGSTSLHYLNLSGSNFNDAAARALVGMRSLRTLNLNMTSITDRGLKQLAGLVYLRYLSLRGTRITDRGIRYLRKLRALGTLNVSRTGISRRGARRLLHALRLRSLFVSAGFSPREKHLLRRRYPRLRIYDY